MKVLLLPFVALLLQAPAIPVAPGPQAAIEGLVVNAGNQPVSGAEVRAFWSPPPAVFTPDQVPQTITDKDGRFAIRELGAGGYRVQVRAPGYVSQEYGMLISLSPGQTLQGITVRLVTDTVISGRITSTSGSPLLKMDVYALRKVYDAFGWATFVPQGVRGETNDRGEYRITGLGPGKYCIRASSPSEGRALRDARDARLAEFEGVWPLPLHLRDNMRRSITPVFPNPPGLRWLTSSRGLK